MPRKEELIRRLAGAWIRKAEEDLKAAEALFGGDPPLLFPSCFHSQQAAEKYLKALLTTHQVEFPKTHSIRELLDLVHTFDGNTAAKLQPAVSLAPYGVETRYPGDAPEPDSVEAKEALALARLVEVAVKKLIGQTV